MHTSPRFPELYLRAEFETFWWASLAYFLLDFAWILLDPVCVKSPAVLLIHHIVAVLYMMLPFNYPRTAPKMSYVMTVEVCHPYLVAPTASSLVGAHVFAAFSVHMCGSGPGYLTSSEDSRKGSYVRQ